MSRRASRAEGQGGRRRFRRWVAALDATVLLLASAAAVTGFPASPDASFTDRLLTAIGARTASGSVSCDIPGSLDVGRHFACHGTDAAGTYTVDVVIVDGAHHFRLLFARTI